MSDPQYESMSADERELMKSGLGDDGMPPEDESEAANRAALAAPGNDSDEAEPAAATAAPPAPAPAATEATETTDPALNAASAPAPAPAAATAEAPVGAPAPAPAADPEPEDFVRLAVPDVSALADKRNTLEVEKAEAFKKLMDGDLSSDDYSVIERRVSGELTKILATEITAETIRTTNEANEKRSQDRVLADIATQAKAIGIDYKGDVAAGKQFDIAAQLVAADPENFNLSAKAIYQKAHQMVMALRGVKAPAPAPAPPAPPRGVDKALIPPTLGRAPAAVDPAIKGDEFAHLGTLNGAQYEKAYAAMTKDQQERYLSI